MTEFTISLDNATVADFFDMMTAISQRENNADMSAYLPFMDRFTDPPIVVAELPASETGRVLRFILTELMPLVQSLDLDAEKN